MEHKSLLVYILFWSPIKKKNLKTILRNPDVKKKKKIYEQGMKSTSAETMAGGDKGCASLPGPLRLFVAALS